MTASRSQLFLCWAVLMSMTMLLLWVGEPQSTGRLALLPVAILLLASGVKGVQILWVFLNLRISTVTWKATFGAFFLVILVVVFACDVISIAYFR